MPDCALCGCPHHDGRCPCTCPGYEPPEDDEGRRMNHPYYQDDQVTLYHGDALDVLAELPDASVDAVVCDPPYGLEFMGKDWDAPWQESDVNADAGFHGGGISATRKLPSFTGTTNPKCLRCRGTRRGRRDGTAKVAVCLCRDGGQFPNIRAVEMRAFQQWCQEWASECLRVLKPGGHMLAFGGSRTWHRLASAIEDAGFEIRDSIAWLYGSGFPKSLDVSKAIDKAAGAEREVIGTKLGQPGYSLAENVNEGRTAYGTFTDSASECAITAPATEAAKQWQGWGTALKPSFEPVVVARKPLAGTVAANVLEHGTGALNIDACRIATDEDRSRPPRAANAIYGGGKGTNSTASESNPAGRWPTNVVLDEAQAAELDAQSGIQKSGTAVQRNGGGQKIFGGIAGGENRAGARPDAGYGDSGRRVTVLSGVPLRSESTRHGTPQRERCCAPDSQTARPDALARAARNTAERCCTRPVRRIRHDR